MIDFIEYVVAEVKGKRLSKANAVALVKQFARRASTPTTAASIHPLLHRNSSDLSEQRYDATFTGHEFYLADHQVKAGAQPAQKVLPGVAHLEMARAAIEHAWTDRPDGTVLELLHTAWAQPVVVGEARQVSIALAATDDEQLDFEIYSEDGDQEFVHCQGRARWSPAAQTASLDLAQLAGQMTHGRLEPAELYAACERMGLLYGPTLRAVATIAKGQGELLAYAKLPDSVQDGLGGFVLHPSLMDAALQAAAGLIEDGLHSTQPRVPFAIEYLRIVASCTTEMVAWVRFAPGSHASDAVVKLDIDLCDPRGTVCVQLRGFSSRLLGRDLDSIVPRRRTSETLLAKPVWQAAAGELAAGARDDAERHVVLCGLGGTGAERLAALLPLWHVRGLFAEEGPFAQRYGAYALGCFEQIQAILAGKPAQRVVCQLIVADQGEHALLAGLSGLLKTAALENPLFAGQLLLVPGGSTVEDLAGLLEDEAGRAIEPLIRHRNGVREVLRWEEVSTLAADDVPSAYDDRGVYLITGGLGGLGVLFARDILERTSEARIILTGRGPWGEDVQARLEDGFGQNERLSYRQVGLGDRDQVEQLIAGIVKEHQRLDGILHCAGAIADSFLVKKSSAGFAEVLVPKVDGTLNLDQASRELKLQFFVLFSSISGVMGNSGQGDYAVANGFMDQFAAHRNRLVTAGQRHGRTRSINWPLWQAGGMGVDGASREVLERATGMQPMQTASGLSAFHRALSLDHDQVAVVEGDPTRIRRFLLGQPEPKVAPPAFAPAAAGLDRESLADRTQDYLRHQFSSLLKLSAAEIDPRAALENYGIDSILAMQLTNQLEKTFGSLSKTLFFEYQTIRELTEYFVAQHAPALTALLMPATTRPADIESVPASQPIAARAPQSRSARRRLARRAHAGPSAATGGDSIAIVGLSGRYPEAVDVEAYWKNLRDGKDCIIEIPQERWDWRAHFSSDRSENGRHYSKWGGFISGVDEFDPLFFNISPAEAELMDPQERLFLQHAWMAVEDAGYTRATLQATTAQDLPGQVGVYAGVMYTEYQLFGAEAGAKGTPLGIAGSAASISNRVSYALNLHGPSMTLDTMCSSSLSAIHLACQDLKQGRIGLAIAGGVNVTIHPNKYLVLSAGQFISSDGACQSFGEGGDGYIPGEGVGVVVLKRLSEAMRDGDHIYGIIRGSALTHGGKTNGYTVPNPQAQTSAISRALTEAKVDARHVSYIEAHGTGTKLGDPIEITALNKSFRQYTQDTQFCRIGSAKSNIGHCESAAGIAGLTKILLQMQYRQIAPSLHSAELNPHIDFEASPFVVQQTLTPWEPPVVDGRTLPRIAGISSFGAGGSNAHIIVEEAPLPARPPVSFSKVVVLLSARTSDQLRQKAQELLAFVESHRHDLDLAAVAYTLQVGRETMDERLALVVSSVEELLGKLEAHLAGEASLVDVYRGQLKRNSETLALFSNDADLQQTVAKWIAGGKFSKLADLWVKGLHVEWAGLYGGSTPLRVSLPVYPFAKERYWIDTTASAPLSSSTAALGVLHPLLHRNTSDLTEQRFSSTFTGEEFFLADHQVQLAGEASRKILPGVAQLEMVRAALVQALPPQTESQSPELLDTVWLKPIVVSGEATVHVALLAQDDERIDYEIYSRDGESVTVHCQGRAVPARASAPEPLDLEQLSAQMGTDTWDPARVYDACARMGLLYGPSFRGVTAIRRGNGQVLADLRLPPAAEATAGAFVLHPSVMDAALQAAVALSGDSSDERPMLPFALEALQVFAPCAAEMVAWVRPSEGSHIEDAVVRLDVDVCQPNGSVCVQLRGFTARSVSNELAARAASIGTLYATPVWQPAIGGSGVRIEFAEHHVVLCELQAAEATVIESLVPHSHCVNLQSGLGKTIAQRYSEYAVACLEQIRGLFESKPQGKVRFQVVIPDHEEHALFAGLSGLLRTAALENPQFHGQLLLVAPQTTTDELARIVSKEKAADAVVRYHESTRQILRWQEVPAAAQEVPIGFRDQGVYLITGGLGGLGTLFAKEILERTRDARVILTGRSPWSSATHERLLAVTPHSERLHYRQLDLGDAAQVQQWIAAIRDEHGPLHGIVHSAGMLADSFILRKASAGFQEVLAPKVAGTVHLDEASKDLELDFFVLFSSTSGAFGNPGQADYATANAFMDRFAAHRNAQVAAKLRHGRTLSINWPLWQSGGMTIDAEQQRLLAETTGIRPMSSATGLEAFHRALALPYDQVLVVEGDLAKMRKTLLEQPVAASQPQAAKPTVVAPVQEESLTEQTQDHLRKLFSGPLKLASHKIDPHAALEQYGIDSVLAMKLTSQLERTFGPLSKTLLFEYQSIGELAQYFIRQHAAQLTELLGLGAASVGDVAKPLAPVTVIAPARLTSSRRLRRWGSGAAASSTESDPIAIVGLSGRYPEAVDVETYWENLRTGKDCITEVPKERWDWREYFSEDRHAGGHHSSKWGGFISGVDEFDPLFFNISPVEAELVDPQERLFLQHAWMAIEDAGYTRAGLQTPHEKDLAGQVGVYVGVMYNEYQLFGAESGAHGKRMGVPGSTASIANRVSYALNLHGPSMTLDTMCSSSLTAIHIACADLKLGRTSLAIAGGVNVSIHPNKYLVLSAGQFISGDGHCQSFGEGGDGYIPGEGVGVVVLKRLSDAKRDGDHIYGLIRGSALTHGGKTNGYTVPSPQAQTSAISRALTEAKVDARHVSYIEAHGTGTKLGDPIEVAALSKAFHQYTQDTEFCRIGSAKSNIGHCESAAGIAGLTKVLLQMQHRQIVPSLHSAQLNPHIDFPATPFVVNQELRPWDQPVIDGRPVSRIAGISSFGAGGSNAHMIIEEYPQAVRQPVPVAKAVLVLSAKTPQQLRQRAADLLRHLRPRLDTIDLAAVAYTLQVGREAMEERLGVVVSSAEELAGKLQAYLDGDAEVEGIHQGRVVRGIEALSLFSTDSDLKEAIDKWIAHGKLSKLLELWVNGMDLDWSRVYGEVKPARISLPAYPFAKDRYWIDLTALPGAGSAVLHPFLHANTSDLDEQRYSSTFTGAEFFLADHRVQANGQTLRVLPGVACLEMARAAIERALPAKPSATTIELRNVVWAEPVIVTEARQIHIALTNDGDAIDYEIYSANGDEETVHGQGHAVLVEASAPPPLDLTQLRAQMNQERMDAAVLYAACAAMGLSYGPSFQSVSVVHRGSDQLLAELRLPRNVTDTAKDYVLHPSLMDGALQACVALLGASPEQPRVPFALDVLRILAPCPMAIFAWVRPSLGTHAGAEVVKVDIDLCDEDGNVCVEMHGLSSRVMNRGLGVNAVQQTTGCLYATPSWQPAGAIANGVKAEIVEHHILLCESAVDVARLHEALPNSGILSLLALPEQSIADRYSAHALACFERIQAIFQSKRQGMVLVQIVIADTPESMLFAGLSGLLKTAGLENPQLLGQVLVVDAYVTAEDLAELLMRERTLGFDPLVKYENGLRRIVQWQDVPPRDGDAPIAFQDRGVYLITGGFGGLGTLFAKEILAQTTAARVVLTGRSALDGEKQALLESLSPAGRVSYRQVDLADAGAVGQLIAGIREQHQRLDGVLHSAGMIADRFILRKTGSELGQVLAPKVHGTVHLDLATSEVELDFFVLFSSIAGALGNLGQADYAAANGFLDQFAAWRNLEVAAGRRHGRTRSINWPLWQAGGLGIDPASQELLQQTTGMLPMQTENGLRAFHRGLALPYDQILVVEGDLTQMRRALAAGRPVPPERVRRPAVAAQPVAVQAVAQTAQPAQSDNLLEKTKEYLRSEFSELLKLPAHKIDAQAALEEYGIDSILAMRLTNRLEATFGSLSKTLFFEYQTIAALAGYFVKAHAAVIRQTLGLRQDKPAAMEVAAPSVEVRVPARRRRGRGQPIGADRDRSVTQAMDIAVIGLAGRYPQAENLHEFWQNLQNGRDCITEIPADRWDHSLYYDPNQNVPGKSYSKWGGFLSDVDRFDPLFFNISPKEAALIDPQERLFLETAWQAIEDAGYSKDSIAGRRVGVYVGVMWGHYELFGAESILRGNTSISGSSYASVANRVSYFFDLHGPSIALDTMCSSSMTAIHLACEELRKGEIEAAIAGGVNLTVHPYKYVSLSQGKFAASDGRCRSFGEGGDGYVPGEGVGAVLLKSVEHALRDGDAIYAVIKSSAVNHGGKTNGYTVPNPNAQAALIREALQKADVDPRTMGYIETHGTGTSLGDPIEITGLVKAFEGSGDDRQYCSIGSVKSNIGHLESAAGIAAVTKALLQIQHRQLVPSLHADPLNPNIDFDASPFYVQTGLSEWKSNDGQPRRAGVSSFGAGGSNAHLILEEYAGVREGAREPRPEAFVLSARSPEALRLYAEKMSAFLENASALSLTDLAYTSQVGRTPMPARLAIIASSIDELRNRLQAWLALRDNGEATARGRRSELASVFQGHTKDADDTAAALIEGPAGKAFFAELLANRDLEKVSRFWVLGAQIDWSLLYRDARPRRVSLPTYPFARERCWIDQGTSQSLLVKSSAPISAPVISAPAPIAVPVAVIVPDEEPRRAPYAPQWTPKALAAVTGDVASMGPILILDATDRRSAAWIESLGVRPVVKVKSGRSFGEVGPNVYVLDPEREEHFQTLVERLAATGTLPRTILHDAAEGCDLAVREQVALQLSSGVTTLLHLCKALIKDADRLAPRVLSFFTSEPGAPAPLSAAVSGFLKTLTLENPRFAAKVVEIQGASEGDGGWSLSQILRDELLEGDWSQQEIRYRRDVRHAWELVPQELGSSAALPLRQHGVYLLTGGLGGLGLIFADYLAKHYQSKLVLVGRSVPNAGQEEALRRLRDYGAEILVVQGDVARLEDMEMVVREAKARFSGIHGVIHAAGVNRDAFLSRKSLAELQTVLAPKVYGTINLDLATRGENLDWFVLFSSVAGALGNRGQCDYAYGNRFLDSFAELRESRRRARERAGRTMSINWPLWEEGGMTIAPEELALLERRTGLRPLPAAEGIRYWEDLLCSGVTQSVALYGMASKIAAHTTQQAPRKLDVQTAPAATADSTALFAKTESYLKALIGAELGLDPERIGSSDELESFGLDSVMINRLNASLENELGAVPKTLFYEHETVRALATFFLRESRAGLDALFSNAGAVADSPGEAPAPEPEVGRVTVDVKVQEELPKMPDRNGPEAIAIIGIHGVYPHSATLAEYWENLKQGKDLIDLVPPSRWDCEEHFHPDPAAASDGKIYAKWGGFLDDFDKFDPHYFNISTEEAKLIDPQERLFLESVCAAIEDAGYTRESLRTRYRKARSADVGVFVGVTTNSYHLWAPEERTRGSFAVPTAMPWSIANRVSYFFDFNGPSMPIDTACSSSLVAIHLACESLRSRECQIAVAGGVNLYLHPSKYQSLCQRRMLSLDGKCHSYGAGDDGFVPGEGVGTLILKPLDRAIADQDRIYAVIRGSAYDHSGRSNGYSAPNPNSQAALISNTLKKANIHPESIGYVEGHGTGTQLGDSIEIAALSQAFREQTDRKQFCPVGSVKANIGHSESAAGVAGVAKVILQMAHRQLAPSIHSDAVNPNIEFEDSPFYLQHGLSDWTSSDAHPRRALVNSFGAGGVNACVILEQYEEPQGSGERTASEACLFTLSAKNEDRLRDYAHRMVAVLRNEPAMDLASLCYTLQTGREAMAERLAIVVSDANELIERLTAWSERGAVDDVHRGSLAPRRGTRRFSKVPRTSAGEQSLTALAASWVAGEEVDWERLYPAGKPRRIALPTYPFARERYWVSDIPAPEKQAVPSSRLHPLIDYNSSTLKEISFSSSLSDTAFYAVDHRVHDERIFPGAAFLEMACFAGSVAGEQRVRRIEDIVWIQPLNFRTGPQFLRTTLRDAGGVTEYLISSDGDENEAVVHSEGRLVFGSDWAEPGGAEDRVVLQDLRAQCGSPEEGAAYYEKFSQYGLHYGPSFQAIRELYLNGAFALAKLQLAEHLRAEFGQFILHPSLMDGALQTAAGLVGSLAPGTPYLPFAVDEIEIVRPVPQTCYAYAEPAGPQGQNRSGVTKFNIRLLNDAGEVLIRFKNLYLRPLAQLTTSRPSAVAAGAAPKGRLLSLSGEPME